MVCGVIHKGYDWKSKIGNDVESRDLRFSISDFRVV